MTNGFAVPGENGNDGDLQLEQHTEYYKCYLVSPRIMFEKIFQIRNEQKWTWLSEGMPGFYC